MKQVARWIWPCLALIALAASGRVFGQAKAETKPGTAVTSPEAPQAYLRVARPETNVIQLQVAIRKFVPAGRTGPAIWLAGASHIGESNYFQALQKHLDAQALVLFEGVGPHSATNKNDQNKTTGDHVGSKSAASQNPTNDVHSLQSSLAESLGLTFQMNGINYDRPHFRNSDLSIKQIQEILQEDAPEDAGRDGKKASQEFERLLQAMDGSSFLGMLMKGLMKWLGSNPQFQATIKVLVIETLGQLQGDLTQMRGLPPDMKDLIRVLISSRNQVVIGDLRKELKKAAPPASITVFYGAGHMADLEQRLKTDLKYRADEERWLTAISVNLGKTGLSGPQLDMIRSMIKKQMEQWQEEK